MMTMVALAAVPSGVFAQPAVAAVAPNTLLVLGDSISAEYGLPRDSGWVRLLNDKLRSEHYEYNVVNASISGETTSGGRARLPALLQRLKPVIVIIELGANDGLRGLPLKSTDDNLDFLIQSSQQAGARVLLVGMRLPPNYGQSFTEQFAALFPELARRRKTAVVPFFYADFATRNDLFQPDGLHPTVQAQPLLLGQVWPALKPLLKAPARKK